MRAARPSVDGAYRIWRRQHHQRGMGRREACGTIAEWPRHEWKCCGGIRGWHQQSFGEVMFRLFRFLSLAALELPYANEICFVA